MTGGLESSASLRWICDEAHAEKKRIKGLSGHFDDGAGRRSNYIATEDAGGRQG